ncbi:DUF3108 domain-containing protein [Ramlibacter sp. MMS24-I3-19]|uniref:DUF3108 domain-containing protein n=1 Tax=Ramlibacter sp. MMS24-I3-19 TaxID=3416606 RepID=UPI003CFFCD29
MAGPERLSPRTRRGLLALVAVVITGHLAVLHWASGLRIATGTLKTMKPPMYTRVLTPKEPVQVQAPVAVVPPKPRPRPAARIAKKPSTPPAPAPGVAQETPAAEPPQPAASDAVAAVAPEAAASAAQPAASEPAQAASSAASAPVTASAGDSWPADTRLRYALSGSFRGGPLYGSGRVLWQRQDTRYQARVEVEITPFASFSMTSQGVVDATTLLPSAYEEMRNGKPRLLRIGEREVTLDNAKVVPRPDGVQDTASQFVELSHRFATGRERLEVGRSVTFWMARPGAIDVWTYDIVEREVLATKLGAVEAFHLRPRPLASPHGNIYMDMWFAPTLQYLPVRVRVSMGDEAVVDLLVEGIDQR